jgi:hypothetical protein
MSTVGRTPLAGLGAVSAPAPSTGRSARTETIRLEDIRLDATGRTAVITFDVPADAQSFSVSVVGEPESTFDIEAVRGPGGENVQTPHSSRFSASTQCLSRMPPG